MDPSTRPVASVALDHDVFRSVGASPLKPVEMREAIKPACPAASVLTPPVCVQIFDRACSLENPFHAHPSGSVASQLNGTVTLEVLRKWSSSKDILEERAASQASSGVDDRLDDAGGVFYFLKIGESCRLRIAVRCDPNCRVRIGEISSVRLKVPNSEPVELEKQMAANGGEACEVVALVDPARIRSDRLHLPGPVFGSTDQVYVRLELRLEFKTRGGVYARKLELNRVVYCKMVRPQSLLLVHRLAGSFRQRWKTMPQRAKHSKHGAMYRAKVRAMAT